MITIERVCAVPERRQEARDLGKPAGAFDEQDRAVSTAVATRLRTARFVSGAAADWCVLRGGLSRYGTAWVRASVGTVVVSRLAYHTVPFVALSLCTANV